MFAMDFYGANVLVKTKLNLKILKKIGGNFKYMIIN